MPGIQESEEENARLQLEQQAHEEELARIKAETARIKAETARLRAEKYHPCPFIQSLS